MSKINRDLLFKLEGKASQSKVIKINVQGKSLEVTIDKVFTGVKIEDLITELLDFTRYAEETGLEKYELSTMMVVLILKHFTDIPYLENGEIDERFNDYILVTNALKSLEDKDGNSVFDKILSEINVAQIEKVNKKLELINKNITAINNGDGLSGTDI